MKNYKSFHIVSTLIFNLILMSITFSTDNLFILSTILIIIFIIFLSSNSVKKLKQGLLYFIPFSIITIGINLIFVNEGSIVLFTIMNKSFTLEALIYALALSLKLLIVIYIFIMLSIMVDSDKAVAYFSNKLPKSTLMIMIGIKLIPTMSSRLKTLKDIYSIRGVEFNAKSWKERAASYIPIFSILMEDSLEGAFDIGEAAYIRGFLCNKRSRYDDSTFCLRDYVAIIISVSNIIYFLYSKIEASKDFSQNAYTSSVFQINIVTILSIAFIMILGIVIYLSADVQRQY